VSNLKSVSDDPSHSDIRLMFEFNTFINTNRPYYKIYNNEYLNKFMIGYSGD